jgi:hypothetical protein
VYATTILETDLAALTPPAFCPTVFGTPSRAALWPFSAFQRKRWSARARIREIGHADLLCSRAHYSLVSYNFCPTSASFDVESRTAIVPSS